MTSTQLHIGYASLWKVALPLCAGAFIQFFIVIIDNYFVAQLDGNAMSAVSFVGLIYIALGMLGAGSANAAQILIAKKTGENQPQEISIVLQNAFLIQLVIVAIQIATMAWIVPILLKQFISNQEVLAYMTEFSQFRSIGFIFFSFIQLYHAFWSGTTQTKSVFYSTALVALTTICFDYLFIFGHFGLPALGVKGAALATNLGEGAGLFFLMLYTKKIAPQLALIRVVNQFRYVHELLKLGIPIMIQMLIALVIWIIFFGFIEKRGEASFQSAFIVRNMYSLAWVSAMGFSSTAKTYVSGLLAEKRDGEIFLVLKRLIASNVILIAILTHGLLLYPGWIAAQFNATFEVIDLTVSSMHVVFPVILLFAVTNILLAAVEGSGKTLQGLIIEMSTTVCYIAYAYWITFHTHADVSLIWTSDYVYFVGLGIFSLLFLRSWKWYSKYTRKISTIEN
ncbi:MAG: MATE family efflux transporter [Bacteroidota bacterium]